MSDALTFNPRKVKLAHMLRAKQAFGVNVMKLMKKVDLAGEDGLDPTELDMEEILTFMFLALDVMGKNPTREQVLEMDLGDLMDFQPEAAYEPDPT